MELSTFSAKKTSLATPSLLKLALCANHQMSQESENDKELFGRLLNQAIAEAGLKKITVARKIGVHPTTLSKWFRGEGIDKDNALVAIRTVNEMAGERILDEGYMMKLLLGLSVESISAEPPKPRSFPEMIDALEKLGIEIPGWTKETDFSNYTEDDFEELKDQIAAAAGVKIKRRSR